MILNPRTHPRTSSLYTPVLRERAEKVHEHLTEILEKYPESIQEGLSWTLKDIEDHMVLNSLSTEKTKRELSSSLRKEARLIHEVLQRSEELSSSLLELTDERG